MTVKARLWIGLTVLFVILINYALIGMPLISKSNSLKGRAKAILMKEAKPHSIFGAGQDEEYLVDVLRREKASIDAKIAVLNVVSVTLALFAASWTIFGIVFRRK